MGITDSLKKGTVELLVLKLLQDRAMYGYEITQELQEKSQGFFLLQEGSLYPTLYRMLERGLISDRQELVGRRRTRVYYHLEDAGRERYECIRREYLTLNKGILNVIGNDEEPNT
jgi:PadR family transcriptional regulator PadR